MHSEPARRAAADIQRAAVERHPFPHSDQPVAAPVDDGPSAAGAATIVADLELDGASGLAHDDPRSCGSGVLGGVGERSLHDAVGGEIDARRKRDQLTLDA